MKLCPYSPIFHHTTRPGPFTPYSTYFTCDRPHWQHLHLDVQTTVLTRDAWTFRPPLWSPVLRHTLDGNLVS